MKNWIYKCKKCGYISDRNIAMKPICPFCKWNRLDLVSGTKEEIDSYVKENRNDG